jgi:hypothetical protein
MKPERKKSQQKLTKKTPYSLVCAELKKRAEVLHQEHNDLVQGKVTQRTSSDHQAGI